MVGRETTASKGKGIVIVGAGYGGSTVAKELQKVEVNFTLIDAQEFFHHCVASVRAVVKEEYALKTCIPLRSVFGENFVQGKVVAIDTEAETVTLEDGTTVQYTALVIATGSRNSMPWKSSGHVVSIKDYVNQTAVIKQQVDKAKKIVIIGGGAVGVEVAAEIGENHKDKERILCIHNKEELVSPGFSEAFHNRLKQAMEELGVTCALGERVTNLDELKFGEIGEFVVKTDKNKYSADLVLKSTGNTLNTAAHEESSLPMDKDKRLKVDEHLRVQGHKNIFALGDICATDDPNLAYVAREQAAVVTANLLADSDSKPPKSWQTNALPMKIVLAIGSERAIGVTAENDLTPEEYMVGFKAKDLMTAMWWQIMDQEMPN